MCDNVGIVIPGGGPPKPGFGLGGDFDRNSRRLQSESARIDRR